MSQRHKRPGDPEPPKSAIMLALEKRGAGFSREEEWVGEPGTPKRRPVPTGQVRGVLVPLTPTEWCSLCMREGAHYIGPPTIPRVRSMHTKNSMTSSRKCSETSNAHCRRE